MSHSPNGRRTHKTDTVAGHGRTGQDHGPTVQGTWAGLRCAFCVANCKRNHIKSCLFNLHYKADARSLNSLGAGHVCVLKTIKRKMFDKYTWPMAGGRNKCSMRAGGGASRARCSQRAHQNFARVGVGKAQNMASRKPRRALPTPPPLHGPLPGDSYCL